MARASRMKRDKTLCPCCKGDGWLMVWLAEFPDDGPQRQPCCHCGAKHKGTVEIEIPVDNDTVRE